MILQVAHGATSKGRQQISRNHPAKQEAVATENKWVIEIKELKKFMAEKN